MKLFKSYKNGNYTVKIFDNGTKIRILDKGKTEFKADFPENIDCCISKKCSIGCPYCYESCTKDGEEFDLKNPKVRSFIEELQPGTEIAIGGGALSELSEGALKNFLQLIYNKGVIANITINSKELLNKNFKDFLTSKYIIPHFIHGIGVSFNNSEECKKELLEFKKRYPENVVVHTIVGITSPEDYQWLADNHFKVLVLGYKNRGRGVTYSFYFNEEYKNWCEENLLNLRKKFKTLSFDCLGVEQLNIKKHVDEKTWNSFYMGDDGNFTMYIDLVECKFAKSSTVPNSQRYYFSFGGEKLPQMFKIIKTDYYNKKNN